VCVNFVGDWDHRRVRAGFGNGNAAKTGQLLFSTGPDGESHGLLGKIVVAR
jgi:hypothetical protein